MGSIQKNIMDGLLSGGERPRLTKNAPGQYSGRQNQFFGDETSRFVGEYARYASDFISGEAQGLYGDDETAWNPVRLRVADVIRPSASATRRFDDYKMVLLESPHMDYIRPGTKFRMMGSVWLAINPANISSANANGIVQRCAAVWNHLDYYGNVLSEPLAIEKLLANANDSDAQQTVLITKGYFNVKAQYNKETRQLRENSRMILGSSAYRVTGFSDFHGEFTGDYDSVRMLEFTLRYEEPNDAIDDMERHVAGGKNFSWEISLNGTKNLAVGAEASVSASSIRCGEVVTGTTERPITYKWSSSNEDVAVVDENGIVRALAQGQAAITATLNENPGIVATLLLNVTESDAGARVFFKTAVPNRLEALDSIEIEAICLQNGKAADGVVSWNASGAPADSFSLEPDGNKATISCWNGSIDPLTVTAAYNGAETSATIDLIGI